VARAARTIALLALIAFCIVALTQMTRPGWLQQDTDAYWNAALRLREGQPRYPALLSPDASNVYRYAPWFAAAWIPLTYLPQTVAYLLWTAVLAVATVFCLLPLLRSSSLTGIGLVILMAALLVPAAASGNVQPLLLAVLLHGVDRRSGPLWIATAASLKAAPILLAAVYVGRRQWWRAAATLAITAFLVAPMLAFDLSNYPLETGAAAGPLASWLLIAAALVATILAVRLATSRFGWLAASVAVLLAIPRWSYYQPTFLLLGLARPATTAPRELEP